MATRWAGILMAMASTLAVAGGEEGGAREAARDPAVEARVAYWTSAYAGAELGSCEAPAVPGLSRTNAEMRAIGQAINAWQRCHGTLMERLRAPVTLEGLVEPGVLAAMRPAERQAAQGHVEAVRGHLLRTVEAEGAAAIRWHRDWLAATVAYLAADEAGQKDAERPANTRREK